MDKYAAHARMVKYTDSIRGRVALPLFGSKFRMRKRIVRLTTPQKHYIEPFGGAAAVLINRQPAEGTEVYCEKKESLAALMKSLRDDPERLIWRMRATPYSRRVYNEARERMRQGVVTDVESMTVQAGGHSGVEGGFGVNIIGKNELNPARTSKARTEGRRLGVDASTLHRQGYSGNDGSWLIGKSPENLPTSGGVVNRARSEAVRHGATVADDFVMSAAYVVPESGLKAIETLLSYPPARVETLNDQSGAVYTLFKAFHDCPLGLVRMGADKVDTVKDALDLAYYAVDNLKPDEGDSLPGWETIGSSFYGAVLARLNCVQIEEAHPDTIREHFSHPNTDVLETPRGPTLYLGEFLPMHVVPLVDISYRLQSVDIIHGDALDVIAEWADNPDAMIYADPPYVHSTRSAGSYQYEMTNDDHMKMLSLVKGARAHVLISGYDNDMYNRELAGWRTERWDVIASSATGRNGRNADGRAERTEVAWYNYDLSEWRPEQGALWG